MKIVSILPLLFVSLFIAECKSLAVSLADFSMGPDGVEIENGVEWEAKSALDGKGALVVRTKGMKADEWIEFSKELSSLYPLKRVEIELAASGVSGLTIRVLDATGQNHLRRYRINSDVRKWQTLTIDQFAGGQEYQKWGGAEDGVVHWPLKQMVLVVEGEKVEKGTGTIWVRAIRGEEESSKPTVDLVLRSPALGHVFTYGEPATIQALSRGATIEWKWSDVWGRSVDYGENAVKEGAATLTFNAKRPGYYVVHAVARDDHGKKIGVAMTSVVSILPEVKRAAGAGMRFGVATHFAQGWNLDVMPLIARAGIEIFRDELYWDEVEKRQGVYNFSGKFDAYMREGNRLGLKPLIVMSFANPLYDKGKTPHTDAGRKAYALYGKAILDHYGDQIHWLEVWNEYNGTWCDGPAEKDRPKFYTEMLRMAYEEIKKARADVSVLGGAAVLIPQPYFKKLFANGALESMDAAVTHPYRSMPEGVDEEIEALRGLMKEKGKMVPVWVTEAGCFADQGEESRAEIARYLVRMATLLSAAKCEGFCWYLLRDYGDFKMMGLLRSDQDSFGRYAATPAYAVYAHFIRQMQGSEFEKREGSGRNIRVYKFMRGKEAIRVCWATTPAQVTLKTTGPVVLVDMMGGTDKLTPLNGRISLTLNTNPIYLVGDVERIETKEPLAIPTEQTVDLLASEKIVFQANEWKGATIEAESQTVTLDGKSGEVNFRSKAGLVGSRTVWYRVQKEGKLCAVGGILLHCVDPIRVRTNAGLTTSDGVKLTANNDSLTQTYKLQSIRWVLGKTEHSEKVTISLPPQSQLQLTLPIPKRKPHVDEPLKVELQWEDRVSTVVEIMAAYNPCRKLREANTGKIENWASVPNLPAYTVFEHKPAKGLAAKMGLSPSALHLQLETDKKVILIALAGVEANTEKKIPEGALWRLNLDGSSPRLVPLWGKALSTGNQLSLPVKITTEKGTNSSEIAIPWSALAPLAPDQSVFRFALAALDKPGGLNKTDIVTGPGVADGLAPLEMPLYIMESEEVDKVEASITATLIPLPTERKYQCTQLLADQEIDYSSEQGKNGWSYGSFNPLEKRSQPVLTPYTGSFKPLEYTETVWDYHWGNGPSYLEIKREGGAPGTDGGMPCYAVRRWSSSHNGLVKISGFTQLYEAKEGDGSEVRILVDDIEYFRRTVLHGPMLNYHVIVPVKTGSHVDFVITPGPKGNIDFDSTRFTSKIEAVE